MPDIFAVILGLLTQFFITGFGIASGAIVAYRLLRRLVN